MTKKGKASSPGLRLWSGKLLALLMTVATALGLVVGLTVTASADEDTKRFDEVSYDGFTLQPGFDYIFVTETEAGAITFGVSDVESNGADFRIFRREPDSTDDFMEEQVAENESYKFSEGYTYILVATLDDGKTYAISPAAESVTDAVEVTIAKDGEGQSIIAANQNSLAWNVATSSSNNSTYLYGASKSQRLYANTMSISTGSS